MTGIGTMVIGGVTKNSFRPGSSKSGDLVFCIGLPKCGPDDEVTLEDQEIVKQHHIRELNKIDGVHDMLPVGSKGILHEVEQMAAMAQLKFYQELNSPLDIEKSAGPSTCLIASIKAENKKVLTNQLNVPMNFIGRLDHL
jgi:hypothetical protein